VFSNGILLLAAFAAALIVGFDANIDKLIQLYIIGVFTSFTLSQVGMVRHWNRELAGAGDPARRRAIRRSQAINLVGALCTAVVLVVVFATKIEHGAWLAVAAMIVLFFLMRGINRYYARVTAEVAPEQTPPTLPASVHAVVLVSRLHKPALRALAFARANRRTSWRRSRWPPMSRTPASWPTPGSSAAFRCRSSDGGALPRPVAAADRLHPAATARQTARGDRGVPPRIRD
jgi:hypothetical protein